MGSDGGYYYGADIADYEGGDTEPEIVSSRSSWDWEPYVTSEDVESDWPGRPIYRRPIPPTPVWERI